MAENANWRECSVGHSCLLNSSGLRPAFNEQKVIICTWLNYICNIQQ
jgi:hypothetical protein